MVFKDQSLKQYFTTGIDNNLTNSVVLKYRKTDGSQGEKVDVVVVDSVAGKYSVTWSPDELDQIGQWDFWSYVVSTESDVFPGTAWSQEIIPEGQSIVSKDFVKGWLGITDEDSDFKIEALIRQVEEDYLRIRNAPWKTDPEGNIKYPVGSDVTIADMIGFKLISTAAGEYNGDAKSEKIGTYSITYGGAESGAGSGMYGYPLSITASIKKYIRGC